MDATALRTVLAAPRWTQEEGELVIRALEESGLSLRVFAREHGVPYQRLERWRGRIGNGGGGRREAARRSGTVPVEVALARSSSSSRPAAPRQSTVMATLPRYGYQPTHPLVDANVARVANALRESEQGRIGTIIDLFDDMLERDTHLASLANVRVQAIAGRTWTWQPADESDDAKEAARFVAAVVNTIPRFRSTVQDLADGVLKGLAVEEQEWGEIFLPDWGKVAAPVAHHWIHQGRFAFDEQMQLRKWDIGDAWPGIPLEQLGPNGRDQFVVHMPRTRSAYPTRLGVLRACVFTCLVKRFGLKWWTAGIERFGVPALYIVLPEGADHLRADAETFLRAMQQDWVGVLTGISKEAVEKVEGSGEFSGEAHKALSEYCDKQNSKGVLGQTMTSDDGASLAQANVHDRVREDILFADVMGMADTMREDIAEPILRYNHPEWLHVVPRPVADMRPRFREIQEWHYQHGLLDGDEVRESLGKPPRGRPAVPNPVPGGGARGRGGDEDGGRPQPEGRHAPGEDPEYESRSGK